MTDTESSSPAASLNEIFYVAALLSTNTDGRISSQDIQALLKSRYNIDLDDAQSRALTKVLGEGGSSRSICQELENEDEAQQHEPTKEAEEIQQSEEDIELAKDEKIQEENNVVADEESLDLVQLLSIILIPTFLQLKDEFRNDSITVETSRMKWLERWKGDNDTVERPSCIVRHALALLMNSVDDEGANDDWPPKVNEKMVKELLIAHGQEANATDDELIREMVEFCGPHLNEETLLSALTADFSTLARTALPSSYFDEVVSPNSQKNIETTEEQKADNNEQDEEVPNLEGDEMLPSLASSRILTKSSVLGNLWTDFSVGSHISVVLVVCMWIFAVFFSVTYGPYIVSKVSAPCIENGNEDLFGCRLGSTLTRCVALFVTGAIIVLPLAWASDPIRNSSLRFAIGGFVAFAIAIASFQGLDRIENSEDDSYGTSPQLKLLAVVTLASGCILGLIFVFRGLLMIFKERGLDHDWINEALTPSLLVGEARLKTAAQRKVLTMLQNKVRCDRAGRFENDGLGVVGTGPSTDIQDSRSSLIWTAKQIYSGKLFAVEGVWIPTRLLVICGAQVTVFVLSIVFASLVSTVVTNRLEEARQELPPDSPDWVGRLLPTRSNMESAFIPSAVIAGITSIVMITLHIPSAIAMIMNFRSGVQRSFGSRQFEEYRLSVNQTYMNIGNAIYGTAGSFFLVYTLFGLLILLFVWDLTAQPMLNFLALGLGLTIIVLIKMVAARYFLKTSFHGFYRVQPRVSNLITILMETWYIAIASSVLLTRISQFLLASVIFVGRTDIQFLSDNVNVYGYTFDYVPTFYIADLLLHEAHRHPYIERFSQMCLFAIRDDQFGNRAGAAWRQLFVRAFWPTLRRWTASQLADDAKKEIK